MKQENVKNKKENREELVSYIRMGRELSGRQQILLVIQLSLPAIMAQLTSVAMQYIDASMVGRLGSGAAAAIGLVASTTWLFGGVCNSFSVGFAVQAAQLIGANKLEAARDVLKQALFTISCISVFLAAIGIAISSFLPGWLGGEKAILKDAGHYFLIYVCFLPCSGLNVLAGSMLQSSGNMKVPGILNSLLCLLDVLFNVLFIYGCRMGVAGAALGTGVSELIIASIMLYFACVKSPILHIRKEEGFHLSAECQKKAITLSLPVTFERFVVCLAMIVTTGIVAPLGSVALAAICFGVTAVSLCYMAGYGMGEAAARLVGSLQEIVSRRISPTETAVISVTRFTSGTSWNIIPETARLEGTVRTFNPKVREQIVKLMQAQAEGLEREGYQVEFTWIPGCPATNNDANLAELVRKEAMEEGFHVTLQHPEMGGEDFSCYQELVPGAFFHVGTGGKYPAHNSKFTVDPAALFGASKLMSEIVKKALKAS